MYLSASVPIPLHLHLRPYPSTSHRHPQAFAKVFSSTPDDLDMHVVYDVSHNIAKVRQGVRQGTARRTQLRARRQ